ncbi:MAG: protein kinase [Polyangiaceae bacterium]
MSASGTLLGGRYRVGAMLGKGGMGVVYQAVQEDLGRRVAVKVLNPDLAFHSDGLQRFRLEAQSAAALGHPNIVQVTDFQANAGEPAFLVMEFLEGRSLGQTIAAEGPLSEARVAFIVSQMLSGLSAAHRANLVHRDIKPDNVFLSSTTAMHDLVKLLDFGIAKLQGDTGNAHLTVAGAMIGTPAYMSPEQARGLPIDARTDLYAVGSCMYHALSGHLPFEANSLPALLVAIFEHAPPPLAAFCPGIDPRMVAVVTRAMSKDPAARFASAEEMRAALAPWSTLPTKPPPSAIPPFVGTSPNAYTTAPNSPSSLASAGPAFVAPAFVAPAFAAPVTPTGSGGRIAIVGGIVVAGLVVVIGGAYFAFTKLHADAAVSRNPPAVADVATSPGTAVPTPADSTGTTAPTPPAALAQAHHGTSAARGTNVDAAAPPAFVASAGAPVAAGASHGKVARLTGIDGGVYPKAPIRDRVEASLDAATACFTKFPPPDTSPAFFVTVNAAGLVVEVGNANGASAPRNPSLDRCMQPLFTSMHLGKPDAAGFFRVSYGFP